MKDLPGNTEETRRTIVSRRGHKTLLKGGDTKVSLKGRDTVSLLGKHSMSGILT